MKLPLLSSPLARILLSHTAAFLIAILAGSAYWSAHRDSTDSILSLITRKPLADAANLAFRFGPPDHARVLLEQLRQAPSVPALAPGDEMLTELRLAVLDGEHEPSAQNPPHFAAAIVACRRFQRSNCDPDRLQELAAKLAQQRRK